MKFPEFNSHKDKLDFLVKLSSLYIVPRGNVRALAAKTGYTQVAICRAVRVGRMSLGMAYAIEKAVGVPEVIHADLFTEDAAK